MTQDAGALTQDAAHSTRNTAHSTEQSTRYTVSSTQYKGRTLEQKKLLATLEPSLSGRKSFSKGHQPLMALHLLRRRFHQAPTPEEWTSTYY